MLKIQIDVTKIDKARLFIGKKGTYLNCIMIDTPESEYNDFVIIQEVSKEEREAGTRGEILGNGKMLVKKEQSESEPEEEDSGLPF